MNVKTLVVGELKTNCYILSYNNCSLVIDPGDEAELISQNIDGKLEGIIITHHHFDHVGALNELKERYQVPVYDFNNMKEGAFSIDSFEFEVIYTPGHKEDSITLYFPLEKWMFVGDFIFKAGIGRTDLIGGDNSCMKNSIAKILTYPDDIVLYSGHYGKTTLGAERNNLIFLMNRI